MSLDALHSQLLADPTNDAVRLVFADALMERGDPRGEFIRLQIAEASGNQSATMKARIAELLARHSQTWLPPGATEWVFRRGFLDEARIETSTDPHHPEWALIRELWVSGFVEGPLPFEVAPLAALEHVDGLDDGQLARLVAQRHPRLRGFHWRTQRARLVQEGFEAEALELAREIPRIAHFAASGDEAFPYELPDERVIVRLVRSLGPRLEALWLPAFDQRLTVLQRTIRDHAPKLMLALIFEQSDEGLVFFQMEGAAFRITVRGTPNSRAIDAARGMVSRAGYSQVQILLADRDEELTWNTGT